MTREEKVAAVAELSERFAKASLTLVAENRGLSVGQATRLRRTLKAANGEYKIAKHTLVRRALADDRYAGLTSLLEGPRGLVFAYADPIAVAKALVEFAEQNDKLRIEGGSVEGQMIAAGQVKALAAMPSLDALRACAAQQALAPGRRLASMVAGPGRRIAGAIAALMKKLEDGGAEA